MSGTIAREDFRAQIRERAFSTPEIGIFLAKAVES